MPDHLLRLMAQAEAALAVFDAERWHASRGEGKWTALQLLGHLIDSAANNHQRFVRALAQPRLDWPGYDQLAHVAVQSYVAHLEHHLKQLLPGYAIDYSQMPWPPADPRRQWPV